MPLCRTPPPQPSSEPTPRRGLKTGLSHSPKKLFSSRSILPSFGRLDKKKFSRAGKRPLAGWIPCFPGVGVLRVQL